MLDPLTALGLASNIIQLVDFGSRLVANAQDIARDGVTADHKHLQSLARETKILCEDIDTQTQGPVSGVASSRAMNGLAKSAQDAADDMLSMLRSLGLGGDDDDSGAGRSKGRLRTAVNRAVKSAWKEKDVDSLRRRLSDLQIQLILKLCVLQS
jgi:hypothetical protein